MFAISKVSPGATLTLGDTFQPCPRSFAQFLPVPSVAIPPIPLAPLKFSGEIDRDWALDRRERFPRCSPSPLKE